MDYEAHEYSIAETRGAFKGLLTRLLSEAFYLEEETEIPEEIEPNIWKKVQFLSQYTKPFT